MEVTPSLGRWAEVGGWLVMTFLPTVDKAIFMVGSYGPRAQEYEFVTSVEEELKMSSSCL